VYRWLLLSYPRDYRRSRGAEILDTVRDTLPARGLPRVAVNLLRHGLRARLGRPASRSVVAWAALFTVACGLFAASFGTWLAWLHSRPLHHTELAAAIGQLYPDGQVTGIDTADPPAVFLIYGGPLGRNSASELLLGDGGEYSLAELNASFRQVPAASRTEALAQLRQRLRAAGWDVAAPVYADAYDCVPDAPGCDPDAIPSDIVVNARRGDSVLAVRLRPYNEGEAMDFTLGRATPWTAYPAGVAAFLIGGLGGWCLFGWASRRTQHARPVAQVSVKSLYAVAMFLWWAPILLSAPSLLSHHLNEPHYRWHPLWEWLGQPTGSLPFLLGCLLLTVTLGLAALPHRQHAEPTAAHG
jgi:hypothetical protein